MGRAIPQFPHLNNECCAQLQASVCASIKWGTTCSACSSKSSGEEPDLGSAVDFDVEGPIQGPALLGNSKPSSILGRPFCSALMHSMAARVRATTVQGLSVTSLTSLENQGGRETGA